MENVAPKSVALVCTQHAYVTAVYKDMLIQNVFMDDRCRALIGGYHGVGGGIIASVRNHGVEWFLEESDCSWLWFVDADMAVDCDTLENMLEEAPGPCVLSAATWGFAGDRRQLTWAVKEPDGRLQYVRRAPVARRMEVAVCGMACTLIHREVLEAIKRQRPDDPWHWFGHDLIDGQRFGEDYTFCLRATAAGYPIFGVDTPVPHHKLLPI